MNNPILLNHLDMETPVWPKETSSDTMNKIKTGGNHELKEKKLWRLLVTNSNGYLLNASKCILKVKDRKQTQCTDGSADPFTLVSCNIDASI